LQGLLIGCVPLAPADVAEVIIDTTVQPKNIMFPTDAKLMNRAREKLVRLAKANNIDLRQAYTRVRKFALIKQQRYTHAKQFNRAGKMKRKLATYLDRTIRDIETLQALFKKPLWLAQAANQLSKSASN
jgi:IS5 family transposase